MNFQPALSLKLAMGEPWHKEYWTFLMIPLLSTAACYFIPLFHSAEGMSYMATLPLTAAFSYGHTLSPRRVYYEKRWEKIMEYHDFVLASAKKILLFAAPTGLLAWGAILFLRGYPKELAMFFETATWGLAASIFIGVFICYTEEISKLKKVNQDIYRVNLKNLWKWIIPPLAVLTLLGVSKIYILLDLLNGRP